MFFYYCFVLYLKNKYMPVKACQLNWEPWYKWGDQGACYTYTMWDKQSRDEAKAKAEKQGRAIEKEEKTTNKDLKMQIIKTDNSFNTVLFVALVPFEIDRNGDIITDVEITKTAHDFVRNLSEKAVNVDHEDETDLETAEFVESFIAPVDIQVGLETIPKGSWVVGIKFDDDTYKAIIDWDFVGISIEWFGKREEMMKG